MELAGSGQELGLIGEEWGSSGMAGTTPLE